MEVGDVVIPNFSGMMRCQNDRGKVDHMIQEVQG
jgi:hypothetical protein